MDAELVKEYIEKIKRKPKSELTLADVFFLSKYDQPNGGKTVE